MKLVKEFLTEDIDYSRIDKVENLSLLTDLAVAIKGVLNRVDQFDQDFIDQMTDAWFAVNKQIGKASPGQMKKGVVESVNESVNSWFMEELMATLETVGPFDDDEVDFILNQEGVMDLVMDYAERGADPEQVAQYVLRYAEDNAITPLDYRYKN